MYKIKEEVLQAVLNYLAKQPYAETFQLIAGLQQVEKVEEPKKEDKKEVK